MACIWGVVLGFPLKYTTKLLLCVRARGLCFRVPCVRQVLQAKCAAAGLGALIRFAFIDSVGLCWVSAGLCRGQHLSFSAQNRSTGTIIGLV